jgi:hypothetical protein
LQDRHPRQKIEIFQLPTTFPRSRTSKSNKLATLTPIPSNIRIIKIIKPRPGITLPPIRAAVPGNRPVVAEREGELAVAAGLDGEIELELVVALGDVRVSPVLIQEGTVGEGEGEVPGGTGGGRI